MLRVRSVWESALVRIERIDHPSDVPHVDPDQEVSEQYSINLLEHGQFSIADGDRTWTVSAAELFVTTPGQALRYVHDREQPPADVCMAVCFKDQARDEVAGCLDSLPARPPVVAVNNRRSYLRHRLFEHLGTPENSMALDVIAWELLAAVEQTPAARLYRPAQLSWYAHRIDTARRRLDEDYSSDHTLAQLADEAGMSPFHFARIFGELTGTPPHRYLLQRRLAAALDMLQEGASVTDTSLAAGFESLSHFSHAFRRTFGVPPSQARTQLAPACAICRSWRRVSAPAMPRGR
jgi:AraC-like DNA-binding protein